MSQRAALMKDVAAYKWIENHNATAYNASQEIKVLNSVKSIAIKNHFNVDSVFVFAQIQMDLSKQIENYWLNYWNNPNTPPIKKPTKNNVISLSKLRTKIIAIDSKLFPAIKDSLKHIHQMKSHKLLKKITRAFTQQSGEILPGIPKKPNFLRILSTVLNNIKFKS